jgi:hypothetical protein
MICTTVVATAAAATIRITATAHIAVVTAGTRATTEGSVSSLQFLIVAIKIRTIIINK